MRSNRSMASGLVIPELPYPDVTAAARWLCDAFRLREYLRIGRHRVQLCLGDASIVVVEPTGGVAVGSRIILRVPDPRRRCCSMQSSSIGYSRRRLWLER